MPQNAAYRLFYVAAFLGIGGVLLWPAYYAQLVSFHPWVLHSKWMIQGLLGGLALGLFHLSQESDIHKKSAKFIATADPWILLLVAGLHAFHKFALGDSIFTVWLAYRAWNVLKGRNGIPNSNQVFWFFTWFTGSVGASIGHVEELIPQINLPILGNILLFQCFPAFTFLAVVGKHSPPTRSRSVALTLGSIAMGLSILEASDYFTFAFYARWICFALAFVLLKPTPSLNLYQARLWLLVTGLGYVLLRPFYHVQQAGFSHLYFMGVAALGLLVLSLYRSPFGKDLTPSFFRSKSWKWWLFLVLLATLTRVTPVWVPSTTLSHHIYAATTWVVVLAMWLRWLRKKDT